MAINKIPSERTIAAWQPKPLERLCDGGGLSLKAAKVPGQRHAWRLDFINGTKRHTLSLGVYPCVGLEEARALASQVRQTLIEGNDPSMERRLYKAALRDRREAERRILAGEPAKHCFEDVARRWYATRAPEWMDSYGSRVLSRLERLVFPRIGKTPIADLQPPELLEMCRRIEERGTLETAHRVLEHTSCVFRFGVAEGVLTADPCRDLRGALKKPSVKHFPAITNPRVFAQLLRALPNHPGTPVVRAALQLAPLVFLRPGELRLATWDEFDLDNAMWLVPSMRMKRKKEHKLHGEPHYVPLSRQAVALLEDLFKLTGHTGVVFPAMGRANQCMSNATLNTALRRLGFGSEIVTGHGFRATARTLLHEVLGIDVDVIELQLAHSVKDMNGRAYNRTDFFAARADMMQKWADYIDDLRAGRADYRSNSALPEFVPVTRRRTGSPAQPVILAAA